MARTPFGPFDLVSRLESFGPDAHAAVLSERADVDDELPPRAIVRHAVGTAATALLEEGAVRAGLGPVPHIWRMIRRGHAGGSAFLAFEATVAARAMDAVDPLDGTRAFPIAEALAFSVEVATAAAAVTTEVALANTFTIHDVLVTDRGEALLIAPPPRAGAGLREPLWALAPENRRTMYMGPPKPHVYLVGMLAYLMLAGRRPFDDDATSVNTHALEPLRLHVPDAPPLVDAVVMRALAERPDDRHESMDELIQDLARCTEQLPTPTAHERSRAAHERLENRFVAFTNAFVAPPTDAKEPR